MKDFNVVLLSMVTSIFFLSCSKESDSEKTPTTIAAKTVSSGQNSLVPAVANIAFTDLDFNSDQLSGTLTFDEPEDPTGISGYKIYWGSDEITKNGDAVATL
jgi:hypothetical protein